MRLRFDDRCQHKLPREERQAVGVACGLSGRDWLSVTHCINLAEKLLENSSDCSTDWYIAPIVNPEGYDYSFSDAGDARSWQKNRYKQPGSDCAGINIDRSFAQFWRQNDNPCSPEYSPNANAAVETDILADFMGEMKDYRRTFMLIINENGQTVASPWKGLIGTDYKMDNVDDQYYYWNHKANDFVISQTLETLAEWTHQPSNEFIVDGGKALNAFSNNVTFAFEISSVNGTTEPWLNSERDISTFSQVYQLINSLIQNANQLVPGDYTAYPIVNKEKQFWINIMDHRQMIDVRSINVVRSANATSEWNDFRGPFGDGVSRWTQTLNGINQKQMTLSNADTNNCIDIGFGFDAEYLFKTETVINEILFSEKPTNEYDYGDYWWGGASTLYFAGGIPDNRDSISYPFQPNDFVTNWGGLVEPYWVGGNKLGAQSISVNNQAAIPLSVGITQNNIEVFDRQLVLSSNYIRSDFSRQNRDNVDALSYQVCLGESEEVLQRQFFSKVTRPRAMPDRSMIYDPIFSTWAIYKQSIDETKLRDFFTAIKDNGYRASNVEVDDGYEIGYGDHSFDPAKFPNVSALIDEIHAYDANVTLWVTPFINPESYEFDEVLEMGCFVVGERRDFENETVLTKWWNDEGGMIDFTDPTCTQWFVDHLNKRRTDLSIDGFKFDAGEVNYLLDNYQTHGRIQRPVEWTMAYDKMIDDHFEGISEVRSAWANQGAAYWMRMFDKGSHWSAMNGLQTMVPHGIQSALLGYPFVLPDMVGGNVYDSGFNGTYVPDQELFIRWLEVSAFLPSIQYSISPWQYEDPQVQAICKYWTDFHRDVIAPIYEDVFEMYVNGTDIIPIAPVSFITPVDELRTHGRIRQLMQQFVIGERFMGRFTSIL